MKDNFYEEQVKRHGYWWSGDYSSWDEASLECFGYDELNIVTQVKDTLLMVKDDQNRYERDGCVIYGEPEYAFELLKWIKESSVDGVINLIDFGGSLGTTYHQLKKYLSEYTIIWNVVEQDGFVSVGREFIEDDVIKFYNTIDECLTHTTPNCFISSSALPYIENYSDILNEVYSHSFDWVLLDRISVVSGHNNVLSIQVVPPEVYKAIYPCWFFSESTLIDNVVSSGYEYLVGFDALGGRNFAPKIPTSAYRGFIFKKNKL